MVDFLIVIGLATLGVAATMEVAKNIINAVIEKNRGCEDANVPAYIWWIIGGVLSVIATILVWKSVLGSDEPMTALLSIVTSGWFLGLWIPLVWWTQMQIDMKVIKKYAVPAIKKVAAKKLGVEDE